MTEPEREPLDEEAADRPYARLFGRVRGMAVDLTPLRSSRDYRLLWSGELISTIGRQITVVAVFLQVFEITHSPAAVGLVGLVQLVPLMLTSIGLGPLIDRMDRRTLVLVTELGLAVSTSVLLGGAIAGHPPLGLVYGAVALSAAVSGVASPTRSALIPNLVPMRLLPSAIALHQVMWNTALVVGPALAGVIIARIGFEWAYAIDLITYSAAFAAVFAMAPQPPRRGEGEPAPQGISAIREAFSYLRGRRVLQATFLIDLIAMIFGMPRALFPVLARTQFERGPEVVGALFSAVAFGALVAALTAGWVGGVRRQGRAVLVAVAVWGAAVTAFGLVGNRLVLALLFLAIAGGADVVSAVFRGTILQSSVPDSLRGRLTGVHILVVTGGPRLGDVEAGVVAQAFTPMISVVSGGVACVAGVALLALLVPQLDRFRPATHA